MGIDSVGPGAAELPTGTVTFLFTDVQGSTSAKRALKSGDHHKAAENARGGYLAAEKIGASFYMHHCVFVLSNSVGVAGEISGIDARTIAKTLREQRDAGQELDQWLVLTGLDLLLYRLGHLDLAVDIRRGFKSTVWANMQSQQAFVGQPGHSELEKAATAASNSPDAGIEELVDAGLDILDALGRLAD